MITDIIQTRAPSRFRVYDRCGHVVYIFRFRFFFLRHDRLLIRRRTPYAGVSLENMHDNILFLRAICLKTLR